ncbi:MAG: helix-turn-helix transcriptional regulator [Geminicoccaceae bacterium]|nr:helix-turn-helix transcriptional regulator [Geminicoccaceae bacterium]
MSDELTKRKGDFSRDAQDCVVNLAVMASPIRNTEWAIAVGERLAQARLALELTQEQLASSLNVGRSALANWERGITLADVAAMHRLKDRHGITLDYIYGNDPSGLPYHIAQRIFGNSVSHSRATKAKQR